MESFRGVMANVMDYDIVEANSNSNHAITFTFESVTNVIISQQHTIKNLFRLHSLTSKIGSISLSIVLNI